MLKNILTRKLIQRISLPIFLAVLIILFDNYIALISGFLLFSLPGFYLCEYFLGGFSSYTYEKLIFAFLLGHCLSTAILAFMGTLFGFQIYTNCGVLIALSILIPQKSPQKILTLNLFNCGYKLFLLPFFLILLLSNIPQLFMGSYYEDHFVYIYQFITDQFKHLSLIAKISFGKLPPENPFFAGYTTNYYWLWYILPAFLYQATDFSFNLQHILILTNNLSTILFVNIFFIFLRSLLKNKFAILFTLVIFLFGYSFKGTRSIGFLIVKYLNISPNISVIPRDVEAFPNPPTLSVFRYYINHPQHLFVVSILLFLILFFASQNTLFIILKGFLLGISFGYSMLFGIFIIGIYLLFELYSCFFLKDTKIIQFLMLTAVIAFAFLVQVFFLEMISFRKKVHEPTFQAESKGPNLRSKFTFLVSSEFQLYKTFGIIGLGLHFLISYGPMLIFGSIGFIFFIMDKQDFTPRITFLLLTCLLALICTMFIKYKAAPEISIKIGVFQIFTFSVFTGILFERYVKKKWYKMLSVVIVILALPTLLVDIYNLSNIRSKEKTMRIPASDVKAFIWIKANLPKNAIIQPSPIYNYSLSKELYSQAPYLLIPSLAERSVICCTHGTLKAFGIDHRDISEKMRQLHHMFATRNVSEAISLLKTYKIDYVYIGTNEQALYSEEGLRKFENKTFFSKIFFNEKVKIYKVI